MAPPLNGIGLGCMRLSTDPERDRERGLATIDAAVQAGVQVFDTARAYGLDEADLGHNERLLRDAGLPDDAVVVTKGGMRRPGGQWRPDGRARSLRADAEASAEALGRPADLWLLHAPDPRVKFETSVRAMVKILRDGTAKAVGLSNARREEIRRARELVPLAAVEVELSIYQDTSLRGGVLSLCREHGIPVLAHRPLGGPKGVTRTDKDRALTELAAGLDRSANTMMLDWWSTRVIPLAGASRPETARHLGARALPATVHAQLDARFDNVMFAERPVPPSRLEGDVVVLMGIPGAGKSTRAAAWTDRGYLRLNRDVRGGTLRQITKALDEALGGGAREVVLDNTYLSRASRADVIRVAWRHGVAVRCVHVDTPPDVARARVCGRLLELGDLPSPEALKKSRVPGVFPPSRHHRMVGELEPPERDEGFSSLEVVEHLVAPPHPPRAHVVAESSHVAKVAGQPTMCLAVLEGPPSDALTERCAAAGVTLHVCSHRSGAPRCWCRPPLPGLILTWLEDIDVPPEALVLHGGGPTFERMARGLGARWQPTVGQDEGAR
ncbi:MAG: aldo/keto reductase [Sandaracinaceae bacterium]